MKLRYYPEEEKYEFTFSTTKEFVDDLNGIYGLDGWDEVGKIVAEEIKLLVKKFEDTHEETVQS